MILSTVGNVKYELITDFDPNIDLKNKRILFAMELSSSGNDIDMIQLFESLYEYDKNALHGSIGALIIHSCNEYSTKRSAQDLIFMANSLGCTFIGHPVVEATGSLRNFLTWKKVLTTYTLKEICYHICITLGKRLMEFSLPKKDNSKILVLYSSPHERSNTLDLWGIVKKELKEYEITEIQIENGEVLDCKGCPYDACLHFGKSNACFYGGGPMVKEVLPAIEESSAIVWLCPNYNDAIAANLTAVINRLTVLYRKIRFYDKYVFGVIVSGNSGSDSIAKQLLGALNINKGFILPDNFCITATANDPNAIFDVKNVEEKASSFGKHIKEYI